MPFVVAISSTTASWLNHPPAILKSPSPNKSTPPAIFSTPPLKTFSSPTKENTDRHSSNGRGWIRQLPRFVRRVDGLTTLQQQQQLFSESNISSSFLASCQVILLAAVTDSASCSAAVPRMMFSKSAHLFVTNTIDFIRTPANTTRTSGFVHLHMRLAMLFPLAKRNPKIVMPTLHSHL